MGIRIHLFSFSLNSYMLFVILAPLCPENRNMLSPTTASGKLQQVGGWTPPTWFTSHHCAVGLARSMRHMSLSRAWPS